jgi:hypothetical protein
MTLQTKRLTLTLAWFLAGCGHDVPSHDVHVVSNCNGPERSARFHFDAFDFETNCTGGFDGPCSSTNGVGQQVAGDLETELFELTGFESSGAAAYNLFIPALQPEDDSGSSGVPIVCRWRVDDDLNPSAGKRTACSQNGCWAEIEVDD